MKEREAGLEARHRAILYELVSRLGDTGKIKAQKLVYFLQELLGTPLSYRFRMHHYGPFSEELDTDLSVMKGLGYFDIKPDPDGYGYHLTVRSEADPEWRTAAIQYSKDIRQVIETFGVLDAASLELNATVHFVNQLAKSASKDTVVNTVSALKPRFPVEVIEVAYDELTKAGLMPGQDTP